MPTPFYHLSIAEELLNHPGLSQTTRNFLRSQYSAFLFGNTAPDVQVVSGQERRATHFFTLPIHQGSKPAWEKIFEIYPNLAFAANLPPTQAAFLAGYLCHLQSDWIWIVDIFFPVFGPERKWGTFPQRLYLHNVLRAYLDLKVLPTLPAKTAKLLRQARPKQWLPFTNDAHLREWRDYITQQLEPGAAARTVEVFAARQGISPQDFYNMLVSEDRMDKEIFKRLPRRSLRAYRQVLLEANMELLHTYLSSDALPFTPTFPSVSPQPGRW